LNNDERDIERLSSAETDLSHRLVRLSPLIREQQAAEMEIDQAFYRNLRAHLVLGDERVPHPGFARELRARLMQETAARPVAKPLRQRLLLKIGAGTIPLLIGLLLTLLLPRGSTVPTMMAPYPTRADLLFSFPVPRTVIEHVTSIISVVHPRSGVAYSGHLRLTASHLPNGPATLSAYRLAAPSHMVPFGRGVLGIRAHVRHAFSSSQVWEVAADGGVSSRRPLHSLAVSLATGELIYHDRRNFMLPRAVGPLSRPQAIAVARRWLIELGWPGDRMPLSHVQSVHGHSMVREVAFGWMGVGQAATAEATLWITPDRSVIEAWVWPAVVKRGLIHARSVSAAWTDVRTGRLPVAVAGLPPDVRADGVGVIRHTNVVSILSPGHSGGLYLVPTYRFEGEARISGANLSSRIWYSLAPSGQQ